jgi:SAM-dependent methyltransferase
MTSFRGDEAAFDPRAVRHVYEMLADGYVARFGDDLNVSAFDRGVLDAALDVLGPSGSVLDLGCGPGQVASYVMARGFDAVGVDLTPAMLDVARRRTSRLPLVNGDLLQLPVRADAVDGSIAWYSFHHLHRTLLDLAVGEVRRTLRREGVFVAATHAGIGQEAVEHDRHGAAERVLITYYEAHELRSVLACHHFEVVDVRSRRPLEHEHAVTKLFITAIAT